MKKNLLSCLVAASLVFGVGVGYVQTAVLASSEGGSGPEATAEEKATDEQKNRIKEIAGTQKEAGESDEVTKYNAAIDDASAALAGLEDMKKADAETLIAKFDEAKKALDEKNAGGAAQPDQPKPGDGTGTGTDAGTQTDDASTQTEEEKTAMDEAKSAYDSARAYLCNIEESSKIKQPNRYFIEAKMEAVKVFIDDENFDEKDEKQVAALKAATKDLNNAVANEQAGTATPGEASAPKSDDLKWVEQVIALRAKANLLEEVITAIEAEDSKSKFFDCYTGKEIDKHFKSLKVDRMKAVLQEAREHSVCSTHKTAEEIVGLINDVNTEIKKATKCDFGASTDPVKPGKTTKPGKAAGKPALPATGEVATALPLVLFASASVLTALRKKH